MQDRFAGDVGDFGKYGLLRHLCTGKAREKNLSLGVVWYLVPDENHNSAGKHTSYLVKEFGFRECDRILFDALKGFKDDFERGGERSVRKIQSLKIFPSRTVFHDQVLTFENTPSDGRKAIEFRLEIRRNWVERALRATKG
ncbi:MAG: hypothetical protein HY618_00745 [Candidatus Tectomicrobia bacterium]|uniref:Uncharacterized protein n=1 Tax=Tectimicrobiota bacterium TaxID=2528274 RepID=A0A932ZSS5_UNCTE|nr:hypothetical protein [Candidatus Tectomicrobia bacterium]MBI3026366.1 hypothetical protein [Candidatus Tectomicrobia bacterium]MBI4250961.1 hypothetical protein [Candidatus Tectomicrobia bacterium]